jgi:hypothetical protein
MEYSISTFVTAGLHGSRPELRITIAEWENGEIIRHAALYDDHGYMPKCTDQDLILAWSLAVQRNVVAAIENIHAEVSRSLTGKLMLEWIESKKD